METQKSVDILDVVGKLQTAVTNFDEGKSQEETFDENGPTDLKK